MEKRNFVIRRVHSNGTIRIYDKVFAPSEEWLKYDGRFNNLSLAFGLYWCGDKMEDFVSLWGTKEEFNTVLETKEEFLDWLVDEEPSTFGLVDDTYPWVWWSVEEERSCSSK